jgi:hypothetical protein
MSRTVTSTEPTDSHDSEHHESEPSPRVEWIDDVRVAGTVRGVPYVGVATYYRLRCIALEATIAALQAELDRYERRTQRIRDRYEDILQGRECEDSPVFTR